MLIVNHSYLYYMLMKAKKKIISDGKEIVNYHFSWIHAESLFREDDGGIRGLWDSQHAQRGLRVQSRLDGEEPSLCS